MEVIYRRTHDASQFWMRAIPHRKWSRLSDWCVVSTVADEKPVFGAEPVLPQHEMYEVDLPLEIAGKEVVGVECSIFGEEVFAGGESALDLEVSLRSRRKLSKSSRYEKQLILRSIDLRQRFNDPRVVFGSCDEMLEQVT